VTLVLVQRRRLRPLRRRWKGAVQTLISTAELVRDADTLADDGAAPADRCATARSSGLAAEAPSWPQLHEVGQGGRREARPSAEPHAKP